MNAKVLKLIVTLALGVAGSVTAHADCVYPKAPAALPNGATATEPEMIAAMQAFKAYDAEVKAFGTCLEQDKAASMHVKTMQSKKLSAAMQELQAKASEFNQQVRVFKARAS